MLTGDGVAELQGTGVSHALCHGLHEVMCITTTAMPEVQIINIHGRTDLQKGRCVKNYGTHSYLS